MVNSQYMFGSHKSSSLWLEFFIKYWLKFEFRWSHIMHIVSVVPPSSQTKGPQSNKGQNVQYFQLGFSQRSSNKQRKKITFKL